MAGTTLGTAYIQIAPSAKGIKGSLTDALSGEAEAAGKSTGASIATFAKKAIKVAAIGTVIKSALEEGANLQQSYFGGLDTLYGDAADAAREYAREAAAAGVSMNEYSEQAVSFGAALKQAFGGDATKAVEAANTAIMDMADNAAKMGTDIGSIQAAYQGFAKDNYTMLDNLKLGYAGSKAGMEQLIADANEYARSQGLAGDLVIDSFADQVRAIELIQEKQGIAGTTAAEAAHTISGSLSMLGASWTNFLTELGNGNGDIEARISELAESLRAAASNIIPTVISIAQNLIASIPDVVSQGFEAIRKAFIANAQTLEEKIGAIKFFAKLEEIVAPLRDQVLPVVQQVFGMIAEKVQQLAPRVMDLAASISRFLGSAFQTLSPVIYAVVDVLGGALGAAIDVASALFGGLADAINGVADVAGPVVDGIVEAFEWLMEQLGPIFDTIGGFFTGVGDFIQDPLGALGDFVFGTDEAAKATESASRDMARSAKQGYGKVANEAKTATTSMVSSTKSGMSQVYSSVRSGMDAAVATTKSSLQTISSDASSQFQKTQLSAQTAFNAVKSTIGNSMSSALSNVRSTASSIQSAINGVKGKTVDIKAATNDVGGIVRRVNDVVKSAKGTTVDVNVRKTGINGVKAVKDLYGGMLSAVRFQVFAQGGIINAPVFSLMGEAGTEAVLPLSPSGLKPFAQAMATQLDGAHGGVTINVARMEVRKESDIDMIANRLNAMVGRANGGRL